MAHRSSGEIQVATVLRHAFDFTLAQLSRSPQKNLLIETTRFNCDVKYHSIKDCVIILLIGGVPMAVANPMVVWLEMDGSGGKNHFDTIVTFWFIDAARNIIVHAYLSLHRSVPFVC